MMWCLGASGARSWGRASVVSCLRQARGAQEVMGVRRAGLG